MGSCGRLVSSATDEPSSRLLGDKSEPPGALQCSPGIHAVTDSTGPSNLADGLAVPLPPDADNQHRRGGWRELLGNRRFLLIEASGSFAGAGYAVYSVSVLFLAYRLSGNLLIAGIVLFIEGAVYTATFLIAPLVDRAHDKRTILLLCYPVQAAAAAALALTFQTGTVSVPLLLGLVFVLAVGWDFLWAVFMVAPRLILDRRQLFVANGLSSIVGIGSQLGGYAGGGALLFFIGPTGGALAYVVLLLAAAGASIPVSLPVENPPITLFWETFRRGWDYFRGSAGKAMRAFASLETFYGFFVAVPPLLITAIAYERFATPSAVYGALVTVYALGGSVAGVGLGHLNPRKSVGALVVIGPIVAGILIVALVPTPASAFVTGGLLAGVGAAFAIRYTAKYAWVQASFPAADLGRVTSNFYLFTGISSSLAVILVGFASVLFSLTQLEVLDAGGLIAAGVIALAIPSVRRLAF